MINRILIRIKVVQLLYSYLLLDQDFEIEGIQSPATKEKRFSHALYLDLMYLLCQIADKVVRRGGTKPLAHTRFVDTVMADQRMKALEAKYRTEDFPFRQVVETLAEEIAESDIFKNFVRHMDEPNAGVRVWEDLFNSIISRNTTLHRLVSERELYSPRGAEKSQEMLRNTFRQLYATQGSLDDMKRVLRASLEKSRELYFRLLTLPMDLTTMREKEIEDARNKFVVTDSDRNPNLRFVENQLVLALRDNQEIQEYFSSHKVSWITEQPQAMRNLLNLVKNSNLYREYMDRPFTDFSIDCEFWKNILRHVIFPSPEFLEMLEDSSVFWNDDLEIIGNFVIKTLKKFAEQGTAEEENPESPIMAMYKDEEDSRFGIELFTSAARQKDEYRRIIKECIAIKGGWEMERLALMDVVIMVAAMAEIVNFPSIPLSVSVNEYIEMARYYSTPKSAKFVHGILGEAINRLREENKTMK